MKMRKFVIEAFSYDEAKAKALENGLTVVRNVTMSYKNAQSPRYEDLDAFCEEILKKHKLDATTGVGCMVVMENGSADTRERPYEFENVKSEGTLSKKRMFEIRTVEDDVLVASADNKAQAARLAKAAMKNVKRDLICKQVYKVDSDHETAFRVKYTPSLNTKLGKYLVFGN
jgi:hypothetical protein